MYYYTRVFQVYHQKGKTGAVLLLICSDYREIEGCLWNHTDYNFSFQEHKTVNSSRKVRNFIPFVIQSHRNSKHCILIEKENKLLDLLLILA